MPGAADYGSPGLCRDDRGAAPARASPWFASRFSKASRAPRFRYARAGRGGPDPASLRRRGRSRVRDAGDDPEFPDTDQGVARGRGATSATARAPGADIDINDDTGSRPVSYGSRLRTSPFVTPSASVRQDSYEPSQADSHRMSRWVQRREVRENDSRSKPRPGQRAGRGSER